ncbi:hypothetical protein Bbelb_362040 [Branchiostoma belcheri]|nr:hypothetical protein Bbelb_362040 [Branchiostoma belcheri]
MWFGIEALGIIDQRGSRSHLFTHPRGKTFSRKLTQVSSHETLENFYLRWGTHYIKSAKFGGQLKIIKTKQATKDLSMSEFATKAEADWKMTLSTFSAQASQTKSSSWWHEHETNHEEISNSGEASTGSKSNASRKTDTQVYVFLFGSKA